jgi:hypothetical protein
MPQTCKEERAAYQREYHRLNKDKKAEYNRVYNQANKEKKAEYRQANKEKIAEQNRVYNQANKEKKAEKDREYRQTPTGIKVHRLSSWKNKMGVVGDLSKFYDERYLPATHCEVCEKEFKNSRDKHMDHCHTSGKIRHVLCCSCNSRDHWKKVLANKATM